MVRHRQSGFTLVELLVAMLLFAVGLLGLVSTTSLVAQMTGDGAERTLASRTAQSTLDSLAVTPCASLSSGASAYRTAQVDWAVTDSAAVYTILVTVRYPTRRGNRAATFRLVRSCVSP
jgi:type IV pilus modification protein PilV